VRARHPTPFEHSPDLLPRAGSRSGPIPDTIYYDRLQHRNASEWHGEVTLFYGDMRSVELPAKVDILVSELLGSFGDNELSPECLDGAQRFLQRTYSSGAESPFDWPEPREF
jgi:hypothetical protein